MTLQKNEYYNYWIEIVTENHIIVYKLLVFDRDIRKHITVKIISIKLEYLKLYNFVQKMNIFIIE